MITAFIFFFFLVTITCTCGEGTGRGLGDITGRGVTTSGVTVIMCALGVLVRGGNGVVCALKLFEVGMGVFAG